MTDGATTDEFDPERWYWGAESKKPRLLHAMFRVKDFDESLRFYVDALGMKVIERVEIDPARATAIFVGYEDFSGGATLELTNYWDRDAEPYTHGTGYGHIALGVLDMKEMVERLDVLGVEFTTRPKQFFPGGPQVAFMKDPDGYTVELVEIRRSKAD